MTKCFNETTVVFSFGESYALLRKNFNASGITQSNAIQDTATIILVEDVYAHAISLVVTAFAAWIRISITLLAIPTIKAFTICPNQLVIAEA